MRRPLLCALLATNILSGCLCGQIPDVSANFDAGTEALCAPSAGPSVPPALAYWPLDDAGTVVSDVSGHHNNGVLATWRDGGALPLSTSEGKYCGALAFDGDGGYVELGFGNGGSLELTGSMTVSAWIRLGTLPSGQTDRHADRLQAGHRSRVGPLSGWERWLGRIRCRDRHQPLPIPLRQRAGERWALASCSRGLRRECSDPFHRRRWCGDIPVLGCGRPRGQYNSSNPVHLGVGGDCARTCARTFNGLIDEVRIYDSALNSSQLAELP